MTIAAEVRLGTKYVLKNFFSSSVILGIKRTKLPNFEYNR